MNDTKLYWVNFYNHKGMLMGSTPYKSYYEAKEQAEEIVELLNKFRNAGYVRKEGTAEWNDEGGRRICVQNSGDNRIHFHDTFIAYFANFREMGLVDMDALDIMINVAYNELGGNADRIEGFVDRMVENKDYVAYNQLCGFVR